MTAAVETIYRLSPVQEGMLFHTLDAAGSGVYLEQAACTLRGQLEPAALRRAWEWAVARHPALRASFHWEGMPRPVQVVHRRVELPWREEDWRGLAAAEQAARLAAVLDGERRRGFDLERPPLLRFTLARLEERTWRFLWTHHHLLLDGWSLSLVLQEVFAAYAACRAGGEPLLPPPRPYVDYVAWLEAQDLGDAERFWRAELAGVPAAPPPPLAAAAAGLLSPAQTPSRLASPARTPAQVAAPASGEAPFEDEIATLPAAATHAVAELGRRTGLTLGTLMHGAWALLLAGLTGEEDVVLGSVVSGRPPHLRGAESMVGLFINTLPLRVLVAPAERLLPWLAGVQRRLAELRRFEHSPLAAVRRWSGLPAGAPLFSSLVAFENYPRDAALLERAAGLAVRDLAILERTELPLNLAVVPGRELMLKLTWDRRRLEPGAAARLLRYFATLLEEMARDLERRVSEVPLLPAAERRRIVDAWSGRGVAPAPPDTLHGPILAQAAQAPAAPAVTFARRPFPRGAGDAGLEEEVERVSYGELVERAGALAGRLRALGAGPETLVGVLLERSPEAIVALLGVLLAGGAYLPLDPDLPPRRLRGMLEDAGAPLLVTRRELGERLGEGSAGARLVLLDDEDGAGETLPYPARGRAAGSSDDAAYVIYTSGSTGHPKGVVVPHRAVANAIAAARALTAAGPSDRVLQAASLGFDASVLEIFLALHSGASLHVLPRERLFAGRELAEELRREAISILSATPPHLLEAMPAEELPALRAVFVGADRCPAATAARWSAGRIFWNLYGPTEAAIFATAFAGPGGSPQGPPIGRPMPGVECYVLDRWGRPLPAGVAGELYLGGAALARSYLGRPDLTAERFVPHPFAFAPGARLYRTGDLARWLPEGDLEFLGRADRQVKIRGQRVELGEIEAVLADHPEVAECAVEAREAAAGRRLVAWVAPRDGRSLAVAGLRRFLAARLPEAMLPAAFVPLPALPRTPAGKIDRRALPQPSDLEPRAAAPAASAPHTAVEAALARIWAEVLRVPQVGVDDDFFALGGDSILSLQVVSRAAEAGLHLTPRQLFDHPTVAALAAVAVEARAAEEGGAATAGPVPLTPIQRQLFTLDLGHPGHWNMAVLLSARQPLEAARVERALALLIARHDALRLRFARGAGGWTQRVAEAAEAEVPLSRLDLSGLPPAAAEQAFLAAAEAQQAGLDLARAPLGALLVEGMPAAAGGPGAAQGLLVVVHHLAIDAVSWRVLLEDLERAYRGSGAGETRLPPPTTSFKRWAERLEAWGRSPELERELGVWTALAAGAAALRPLPLDDPGAADVEGTTVDCVVSLEPESTRALLKEAHAAYQTRPDELLAGALAEALAAWTGERAHCVAIEGHGREAPFPGVDLSRTVGWFTVVHPVLLDLSQAAGPGEVIKAVKEQLRRVPHRGLGWGLLRDRTDAPAPIRELPRPQVSLNYLGQLDLLLGASTLFDVDPAPPGRTRSPRAERFFLLEVGAWVRDGRLVIAIRHGARHRRETIERLATNLVAALRRLIDHCVAPAAGGFTPSDFPAADLDQRALDKLLGEVAAGSAGGLR
jgi:amino acid adenylation domain-containing protein/non-ribosomal peptide synthase protein (TIGR01720 family)